jgi:hypothetical protein
MLTPMADPADLCVYCTTAVLSSDEKPEHVIPSELGGVAHRSLSVHRVQ